MPMKAVAVRPIPGTKDIMTNLRILLLATTALSATQLAASASLAQTAPLVVAQAKEEGPPGAKKEAPPKGAPPAAAPKAPAPPPPPAAAPPRPAAPPPPPPAAAPPPRPTPPPPPPAAAPPRPTPPPPPPAAAPKAPTPPPPPPPPPPAAPKQPAAPTTPPPPPPSSQKATPSPVLPPPPPAGVKQPPAPTTAPAPTAPPTVAPAFRQAPQVTAPLPAAPPPEAGGLRVIAPGAPPAGPQRLDDFRGQRRESQQGGRTIITEPGRIIIRDPGGQQYVRHSEVDRFRYGARDIQTQTVGAETRTVVIRPDGTQVITVVGRDGQLLRRIRRDERGREIIIIDNSYRDPRGGGGFYVALAPPVVRIPYNRYIVDSEEASPEVLYETMMAPPVERIERRYSLDEIRYSPTVRQRMPSIDVNTINFELGSWEVPPDQAAKLQAIADGLNRAIQQNPRAVFLIEGHTDAVGNDVDNLSLSDRRAESAATLLTQQFNVPAENLTSQGYGEQYLKEPIDGPSAINRRVTIRNITPLLNGGTASLPPPPPGTAPPR